MDSSHVSLVSLLLRKEGFGDYEDDSSSSNFRCDRECTLGINLASLGKILKCMNGKDIFTMRYEEESDVVQFVFESPGTFTCMCIMLFLLF